MNKIARTITQAKKDRKIVKLQTRLAKNGRFSSVKGRVSRIKVNRDGAVYIVVDRGAKARY